MFSKFCLLFCIPILRQLPGVTVHSAGQARPGRDGRHFLSSVDDSDNTHRSLFNMLAYCWSISRDSLLQTPNTLRLMTFPVVVGSMNRLTSVQRDSLGRNGLAFPHCALHNFRVEGGRQQSWCRILKTVVCQKRSGILYYASNELS